MVQTYCRCSRFDCQVSMTTMGDRTAAAEDENDIDLFGSDDEEAEKIKAARVAEYNAKKVNKPKPLAKTTVTLEVKPWDDETDMEELTKGVRAITMDGSVVGWFSTGGHWFRYQETPNQLCGRR
ncbi:unnamed protein product [Absidia cylindrospora]